MDDFGSVKKYDEWSMVLIREFPEVFYLYSKTTINMPMDLEMLLSATRSPLFSYTPFADDHFSLTNGYGENDYSPRLSLPRNHFLVGEKSRRFGIIQNRSIFPSYNIGGDLKETKKKTSTSEDIPDGTRKKKVSFADDKGLDLVEVREIPDVPKWTNEVLSLLIGGSQKIETNEKVWKFSSEHPPREDSKLLELLKQNSVVLESVNIKKGLSSVLNGTIKVRNLAFEKHVFTRITYDRWMSYADIKAEFMKPKETNSTKQHQYDTFFFSTEIPASAMRFGVIEFCACFRCDGNEYWDNNGGINYRLTAELATENSESFDDSDKQSDDKITLSFTENIERFSEIDAWSNFMYNQPYW
ncbi:protein phosphatase 1 regulatory subunit 3B-B [Nephila pilipes]|uniref:Protein phosphatase 1 regulatory subunit 3B-B n=1 Tax=Nephila pilipes TaxID=299642 RepID=A0A8X6QZF8_NEPPI|nr:protein phosphatase 1 regulatory subunit 3B-B [Nephila pilipes]